jgi:CelD/BcsL family acetyltransferase involved in cellulose biosynthesis
MKVEIVPQVDAAAWNERARTMPGASLFQTSHWAEYMRAYLGARPHYLVGRENGEVVMQLLLLESLRGRESISSPLVRRLTSVAEPLLRVFGWREGPLVQTPSRSPAALAACLPVLEEAARVFGATALEDAYHPVGQGDAAGNVALVSSGYQIEQRSTLHLDLRRPLADLWKNLEEGVARTPVRKARRQGLVFQEVEHPDDVTAFTRLVQAWRQQQRLVPFPPAKYHEMFLHLRPYCSMFLARHDSTPVGGIGVWHFGGKANLFTPVQSMVARERHIYAGDFLYWNLIEWCHARGLEVLDLSGISLSDGSPKDRGIRKFKEKWGGRVVSYAAFHRVFKPVPWRLMSAVQSAKRTIRAAAANR